MSKRTIPEILVEIDKTRDVNIDLPQDERDRDFVRRISRAGDLKHELEVAIRASLDLPSRHHMSDYTAP